MHLKITREFTMSGNAAQPAAATNDKELVAQAQQAFENIRGELDKVIVGQDQAIEELIIAIFARGHCMLP